MEIDLSIGYYSSCDRQSCIPNLRFSDIEFGKRAIDLMYQVPQPREGSSWEGSEPEYQAGYPGNLAQSDQLADAIARRLQSQTPSSLQGPVGMRIRTQEGVTAGQRLALAIVSIALLVPLSSIVLSILGVFAGLIGLGIICAVILGINFVFNIKG